MRSYSRLFFAALVALCVVGFVLLGMASDLPGHAALGEVLNATGGVILVADMALVLLADWRGFLTLNGLIRWRTLSDGARLVFGLVYLVFGPVLLIVYLVQVWRQQQTVLPALRQEARR